MAIQKAVRKIATKAKEVQQKKLSPKLQKALFMVAANGNEDLAEKQATDPEAPPPSPQTSPPMHLPPTPNTNNTNILMINIIINPQKEGTT